MNDIATSLSALPRVVDNTILSKFRTCQRKAYWAHVHRLAPPELGIDLHAGGCFASALESVYRSTYVDQKPIDYAMAKARLAFEVAWGDFIIKKDTPKTRERMWTAIESYIDKYDPPNDYINPSPLFREPFEYTFAIPLTFETLGYEVPKHPLFNEPFLYAGKFDMVGEHYGQTRIRDDKTTTALGPMWEKRWTLSSQLMGYCFALDVVGYPCDTVEIRGVGILKTEIKHQPIVKSYTNEQMKRFRWQISRDISHFVAAAINDDWDYNFADACSAYGGCEFMDLCRANNPSDYFSSYTRHDWNPLDPPDRAEREDA
jgi:hypothetical protein